MKDRKPWYICWLKILSLFLISLSMLASIGLIGFSMQFLVELGYIGTVIGTNSPFYISAITTLAGVITFVMTPLGLFSMLTFRKTMMQAYCVIMLFVISMCLYSSTIAYMLRNEIEAGDLQMWMTTSLREEYGHPNGEDVDYAWDRLQQDLNCCGVRKQNGSEWQTTMWYKSQTTHPRYRVPVSCCATCDDIHVKYCTSVMLQLQEVMEENPESISAVPLQIDSGRQLAEERNICIKASEFCSSADPVVANEPVCTGQSLPPRGLPRSVFQHNTGCYPMLTEKLTEAMQSFFSVNAFFSLVVLLCCLSWCVLCLLSHDSYLPVSH